MSDCLLKSADKAQHSMRHINTKDAEKSFSSSNLKSGNILSGHLNGMQARDWGENDLQSDIKKPTRE